MKSLIILVLIGLSFAAGAQTKDYSKDVGSVDGIIAAMYECISGEAGAPRDWDRFRNLFKPESRLIPTRKSAQGELIIAPMTPEDYITAFASRIPTGFFEVELHKAVEQFGTVTHVFSTYETKEKKDGPVTNRGINSVQIFHDGKRFYVINIFWCAESMGFTLPEKYLSKK